MRVLKNLLEVYSATGKSFDLDKCNCAGDTALHIAAAQMDNGIVTELLKAGASLIATSEQKESLLHELASLMAANREKSVAYMEVHINYSCILNLGYIRIMKFLSHF